MALDEAEADPQRIIADLRRQLDAEREQASARETAIREVLQAINASPGDLAPVFDAMLEKAHRLCGIAMGSLELYDGERFRAVAVRGLSNAFSDMLRRGYPASDNPATQPLIEGERVTHIRDLATTEYSITRSSVELDSARTLLCIPLRREGRLLGMIASARREVRPFSEKEIALLENFAAQAVIAMENARLITETREALEQQTATAEVLGVINSSPGDLAPVFDAILEKAVQVCNADQGAMYRRDRDGFRPVAHVGMSAEYVAAVERRPPMVPGVRSCVGLAALQGQVVQIADVAADREYASRETITFGMARTGIGVPLQYKGETVGVFGLARRRVEPFTDKQITLLQNFAAQAVIAMENARLITETREALEQQTATAEVLGVINSSPGDLAPVFEAMLEKAMRLCQAAYGVLWKSDGELFRAAALRGVPPDYAEFATSRPRRAEPDTALGQLVLGERFVHIANVASRPTRDEIVRKLVELGSVRTLLAVPLRKDGVLLGSFAMYRREVRPFTDKQIALLQNFAAQAVISMENARLITETREALEQQTATTEVLQVINSSPGDLGPVFDAMLERALRLCGASFGNLLSYDGKFFDIVASVHAEGRVAARQRQRPPFRLIPGSVLQAIVEGAEIGFVEDVRESGSYRADGLFHEMVDSGGYRSLLNIPLRREGELAGVIGIFRTEVRPFSDKQIALLQNFAAQAVIAMENARLITETREALEQQTATAEVLGVINSSPGDLTPVFDAMLEKAMRLCEAAFGMLRSYDGERFSTLAAHGVPEAYSRFLAQNRDLPAAGTGLVRLVQGALFVHSADAAAEEAYSGAVWRAMVDLGGARAVLAVPLRKDDKLVGSITLYRQQARPFTDKQIALLQNFAAQAVIAMENARLLTETREALEQQTATAEVLQVINSSPGDLAPVFDAMLEKAMRLCEAACGHLLTYDGQDVTPAAVRGGREYIDYMRNVGAVSPGTDSPVGRALRGEPVVHIVDAREEDIYRSNEAFREQADRGGFRSMLVVGLCREDTPLGTLTVFRQQVRPFTDKQIALLQNFAAQAVIAMENARLITETREALEQQTATAEVLGVINASPGDLAPVFDAMLEKAVRLCQASFGSLWTYDGEFFHAVAVRNVPAELSEFVTRPYPAGPHTPLGRVARSKRSVAINDLATDEVARAGDDVDRRWVAAPVQIGGARSYLAIPLLKDNALVGAFALARREVRPFSNSHIALLESFAGQAVIAMENARLLGELRNRTRDLEESLEYQTATSDVLQVISRSTFDLQPVLDTLVETAVRLCKAEFGNIFRREGERYRRVARIGLTREMREFLATRNDALAVDRGSIVGRVVLEGGIVAVEDVAADPEYNLHESVRLGKLRSSLGVPLLREGDPIGVITLGRHRVEPFTERQIELVRTFADQAVIAIENTRLLTELRESLEQQQAIAQVLGVINASAGELGPVFDAILEKAHSRCGAERGALFLYDGAIFRAVATRGIPEAFADRLRQGHSGPDTHTSAPLLAGERYAHIRDLAEIDNPIARAGVEIAAHRTVLAIPLRNRDGLAGMIVAARTEVRPFSDKQIALLESFAAQAVIAMDNARLLDEIRQRQAELRVTFDNMGDGVAMFDAELRLAAWNHNFQMILDLPDGFLAERPSFADYFRYLAARGEYPADLEAELSRRIGEAEQQREVRFERERPDGRVIEVRRNPVPGGGFVLMYGDVTERKRAEADIRAARDTAEAALRELQAAQANLIQAEKMASLGQLTAGIAHEIKNPLNFVNNFAGLSVELLDELKAAAAPGFAALDAGARAEIDETVGLLTGNLEKIAEHGKRADNIVKSMLEHSRGVTGERRTVDLNTLVEEALNLAYHGARAQDQTFNITLERDYDRDLGPIELVPQEINRVLINLIGNGFYAAVKRQRDGNGADFRPILTVATRDAGDAVEVRVRDNGTGIAPEIRDKLFQPFFTTKPTGEGTGLGLSISYDIVTQQHGGTITVDSRVDEFTEFAVRLPR